jgi:predicted nucleic acid-binding protein
VNSYLLDTSVIVSGQLPAAGEAAISVVTIGEMRTGVFTANDPVLRSERSRSFVSACKSFLAHDVDSRVAERFGEIHAFARLEGRIKDVADHLIIATAAEHALTLFTADKRQGKLAEDLGLLVEYAA